MQRLTKSMIEERNKLVTELKEQEDNLAGLVNVVIEKIGELNAAINVYNDKLAQAEAFVERVVGEMDVYIEGKGASWGESEAAGDYMDWKAEWEAADFEKVAPVEDIDHTPEVSEELERLTDEPSR